MSAAGTVGRASARASELLPLAVEEPLEAVQRCSARGLTIVCAAADATPAAAVLAFEVFCQRQA
jgi:hypothetical protein